VTATVIKGDGEGAAVTFSSGEGRDSELRGFTITGLGGGEDEQPGIACYGAGQAGPTISGCVITGNQGPGIYAKGSSPLIVGCDIVGNGGDGVRLRSESSPEIMSCVIAKNGQSGLCGGSASVSHCTIAENLNSGVFQCNATFSNSIIWGNMGSQIKGVAAITYCDVGGGWSGLGNIDVDPCFVDPGAGDYHLRSEAGRWVLNQHIWVYDAGTSLCIDAGNPGSLLGSEADHPTNVRVNMGAYGGTAQASRTPVGWSLLADLTNDGIVNFVDLGYWAENWLGRDFGRPADFDRNAAVNMPDYALLAHDWFSETVWHE